SAILNLKGKITKNNPFPEVEEFEKSSIVVKTVKFDENNRNKESMSFGAFKFEELANEQWIDEDGLPSAQWHNFLLESRFLFFVERLKMKWMFLKALSSLVCQKKILKDLLKKCG